MIIQTAAHSDAFALAKLLVPAAVWVPAEGDIGQVAEDDVALEDKESEATLVLYTDGTASFGHHRLVCVTPHLRAK